MIYELRPDQATAMQKRRDLITTIVPTRDEALHIGRCIESARWLGRVVIVDSGSTDATKHIAIEHGAEVYEHAWPGHAAQKNWALDHLNVTTPWVLFLDADEYLTPETASAIHRSAMRGDAEGYLLPRSYVFFGRALRYAWWYPDYQLRLFRTGRGQFEDRLVHEHVIVHGTTDVLDAPIVHENLKGLSAFITRHNRYSDLEAAELAQPSALTKRGSWRGTWADRRRWLKDSVWFRLPGRPLLRFGWMYFVKRGFLDGRRGLLFCYLIAMYEFMIDVKLLERRLLSEQRSSRAEEVRRAA